MIPAGAKPFCLSATIPGNASGASATPDLSKLAWRGRTSYVITDIEFYLPAPNTTGVPNSYPGNVNVGGEYRVRFNLGRMALTSGFIPVWLLANPVQTQSNVGSTAIANPESVWDNQMLDGAQTFQHFRWVLPVPLVIPPGMVLVPTFLANTSAAVYNGTGSENYRVSYRGYTLPAGAPTPKSLAVPYASFFIVTSGASPSPLISGATDLVNPFLVPFKVQKMIGRLEFQDGSSLPYDTSDTIDGDLLTTIKDSQGYNITREPTPFRRLFDERRQWIFKRDLAPKEYLVVGFPSGFTANRGPHVSIIGTRMEQLS